MLYALLSFMDHKGKIKKIPCTQFFFFFIFGWKNKADFEFSNLYI